MQNRLSEQDHDALLERLFNHITEVHVSKNAAKKFENTILVRELTTDQYFKLLKKLVIACGAKGDSGTRAAMILNDLSTCVVGIYNQPMIEKLRKFTSAQKQELAKEMAITFAARSSRVINRGNSGYIVKTLSKAAKENGLIGYLDLANESVPTSECLQLGRVPIPVAKLNMQLRIRAIVGNNGPKAYKG